MSDNLNPIKLLKRGIIDENPLLIQVLALCPALAVTTTAENAVGLGLATTFVLTCSNVVISVLRKLLPSSVRIPAFIVIIAGFVTILGFLLEGFLPDLNAALGIFIPLITTNCLILARVESFAFKKGAFLSFWDGIGMGLGFTVGLVVLASIREVLGFGELFGFTVLPEFFPRTTIMILAPGAFFALGFIIAGINYVRSKKTKEVTA